MATAKDVAREAGVSPSTVSRVLNSSFLISEETRERVYAAMKKVGFEPKPKALAQTNSGIFVVVSMASARDMLCALQRYTTSAGCGLVTLNVGDAPDSASDALFTLDYLTQHTEIKGLFLLGITDLLSKQLAQYTSRFPTVQIECDLGLPSQYIVTGNYDDIVRELTMHLINQNRKRIVLLYNDTLVDSVNQSKRRFWGYHMAMLQAYHTIPENALVPVELSSDAAYHTALQLLQDPTPPDAILCMESVLADGVFRAVHELGLRIPEEVAVAVCGGMLLESFGFHPPLTFIPIIDQETLGAEAVKLMFELLENPSMNSKSIIVPLDISYRASTEC